MIANDKLGLFYDVIVSERYHYADVAAAVTDVNSPTLREAVGYSLGVANLKKPVPLVDWIQKFLIYWRCGPRRRFQ